MKKAVSLTIRGCPGDVHGALEQSAKANRRSLNAETITWLSLQAAARIPRLSEGEVQRRLAALEHGWKTTMTPSERENLVKEHRR